MELGKNQKKWVEALKSGKFKQGRNKLDDLNEGEHYYCCLGVACVIAEEEGVEVTKVEGRFLGLSLASQPEVANWLDIYNELGNSKKSLLEMSLSELNDSSRITFKQIADIIEQEPENYFNSPK